MAFCSRGCQPRLPAADPVVNLTAEGVSESGRFLTTDFTDGAEGCEDSCPVAAYLAFSVAMR